MIFEADAVFEASMKRAPVSRTVFTDLERDAEAPGVVMVFGSFFDMRLLVWFYRS